MTERVLYAELTPQAFRERLAAAPIAYLPLGTLEWHGEHMPLGADGLQAEGFFRYLAREVGGIVLPMLFLGPDEMRVEAGCELSGMDIGYDEIPEEQRYPAQQLPGSAYWVPEEVFGTIVEAVLRQLRRAGFRIVVAHGHWPSTDYFRRHADEWKHTYGLECYVCWGSEYDQEGLGIQVDHGAMNETSLVMAFRPDLVQMQRLPEDLHMWPLAIVGRDPRLWAGRELGQRIVELQGARMTGILREALRDLRA